MTCERTLIHAQLTLWIAPQNLQFTLLNFGYWMSAYKWRWRQNAVILDVLWFANHKRAHLSEFHLWVLPLVTWIDGFSQPGYCMLHSLEQIKNRTDLFSGFWERPVLRKQTLRFQKTMSIGFWNHDGCFLSTAASDNKRKRSWKQTVLFFIFLYTLLACNTT